MTPTIGLITFAIFTILVTFWEKNMLHIFVNIILHRLVFVFQHYYAKTTGYISTKTFLNIDNGPKNTHIFGVYLINNLDAKVSKIGIFPFIYNGAKHSLCHKSQGLSCWIYSIAITDITLHSNKMHNGRHNCVNIKFQLFTIAITQDN